VHRLAWSGLNNVLRHVGLLEGDVVTRASLGLPEAVIIDGRDATNYVIAEEAGLFEGLKEPGEDVSGGEPVGRLWFPDQLDRDPALLVAPRDGIVASVRAVPVTDAGNSVFTIGQPIAKEALL
jgi:predicted deacylase